MNPEEKSLEDWGRLQVTLRRYRTDRHTRQDVGLLFDAANALSRIWAWIETDKHEWPREVVVQQIRRITDEEMGDTGPLRMILGAPPSCLTSGQMERWVS